MSPPDVRVEGFIGEYRLVHGQCVLGGQEFYGGSDVLCLGDEVLERLELGERDAVGFVFTGQSAARAARSAVVNEVLRFRHGQ